MGMAVKDPRPEKLSLEHLELQLLACRDITDLSIRQWNDKKTAHSVCEGMKPFKIAVLIKFAMNFSPL